MKKGILTLLSFIISLLIIVLIFQLVNPVNDEKKQEVNLEINIDEEINLTECSLKCQDLYSLKKNINQYENCIHICNNDKIKDNSFFDSIAMYKYMTDKDKEPDFVIKLIYILIWFALWMQTTLFLFSILCNNLGFLKKYYFHIVDTALNSPPILGVMGTIYSFAIYTTKLGPNSDLIEGFKTSFFDAAFTTIIAGFIYLINLYFKIIILRDEE